jgi:hypothetical protein
LLWRGIINDAIVVSGFIQHKFGKVFDECWKGQPSHITLLVMRNIHPIQVRPF